MVCCDIVMDDQLATSSCLVGSLERFIDITENQNSDSTVLTDVVVMSGVSERKSGVKRRSNNAKQRLSQINQENVGLIEKRVLHRENSAKKNTEAVARCSVVLAIEKGIEIA